MDQKILVTEETNAGLELIQRLNESLPIQAAFWLKDSYEGQWFLYLASDLVTDGTIREGYGRVIKACNDKPNVYLTPLQVKLISLDNPLAKEALEIYERYPGYAPTFLGARTFGEMSIEEGYLYPQSIMAPASSPTT